MLKVDSACDTDTTLHVAWKQSEIDTVFFLGGRYNAWGEQATLKVTQVNYYPVIIKSYCWVVWKYTRYQVQNIMASYY